MLRIALISILAASTLLSLRQIATYRASLREKTHFLDCDHEFCLTICASEPNCANILWSRNYPDFLRHFSHTSLCHSFSEAFSIPFIRLILAIWCWSKEPGNYSIHVIPECPKVRVSLVRPLLRFLHSPTIHIVKL